MCDRKFRSAGSIILPPWLSIPTTSLRTVCRCLESGMLIPKTCIRRDQLTPPRTTRCLLESGMLISATCIQSQYGLLPVLTDPYLLCPISPPHLRSMLTVSSEFRHRGRLPSHACWYSPTAERAIRFMSIQGLTDLGELGDCESSSSEGVVDHDDAQDSYPTSVCTPV